MKEHITERVNELYWKEDINCARKPLACYDFTSAFDREFGSLL